MAVQKNRTDLRAAPLAGAGFGIAVTVDAPTIADAIDILTAENTGIAQRLDDANGLMVVRGLAGLTETPEHLVRLTGAFGPEIEDQRQTLTAPRFVHAIPEIMVLSNKPGVGHPPPPAPNPRFDETGHLRTGFDDQVNWHTDQSYRRPPPEISLLFAPVCPPPDQGQTLFADCAAAYDALDAETRNHVDGLTGIHCAGWIDRGRNAQRAGRAPKPTLAHQSPVPQPVVRQHPVTGRKALYLCEERQMDFAGGPFVGMEPGPDGAGAMLWETLMRHATQPAFVYVHTWQTGDLIVWDNRCLIHCGTWYDHETYERETWRTTVRGNPGREYAGEAKSWLPPEGVAIMAGMEDA